MPWPAATCPGMLLTPMRHLFLLLVVLAASAPGAEPAADVARLLPLAASARAFLEKAQNEDGGWGYRAGGASRAEVTSWALMALGGRREASPATGKALDFLMTLERSDGGFASTPLDPVAGWTTAWVLLALTEVTPPADPRREKPARWLLERSTAHWAPEKDAPGWPWTPGHAPWVEPTAITVWALSRAGKQDHPRVKGGVEMLLQNALEGGGFSLYSYRPYRHHTALVALALEAAGARDRTELAGARRFLEGEGLADPASLGRALGLLAAHRLGLGGAGKIVGELEAEVTAAGHPGKGPFETSVTLFALEAMLAKEAP